MNEPPRNTRCTRWAFWTAALGICGLAGAASAEDWPTFQHDHARSGSTSETLQLPLKAAWEIRSPYPPARGWGEPESTPVYNYGLRRIAKVRFDDAYQVAIVGDAVYYCDSARNQVWCVEAATGAPRWSAYTDAAPRLGPTVWRDRVYVGADDGLVRCLEARTGRLLWQFCAAPAPDRALSQDRVLSLWPVRTGVLIQDDVAYFAAGLFPAEGLSLFALKAATGELIWKNDTFHDRGQANISPQGYLLADAERLLVPSGRVCPTVFERATGKLLFAVESGRALTGGDYALLTPQYLYTGTQLLGAYDLDHPRADKWGHQLRGWNVFGWFDARRIVVRQGTAYLATPVEILAIAEADLPAACQEVDRVRQARWEHRNQLAEHERVQERLRKAEPGSAVAARSQAELERLQSHVRLVADAQAKLGEYLDRTCRWRRPVAACESLILAGETLLAGGDGAVFAIDTRGGRQLERWDVHGTARGLAVAGGRLFVSTTTGRIHCFGPAAEALPPAATTAGGRDSSAAEPTPARSEPAARIPNVQPGARGYALVLGHEADDVAMALANATALHIQIVSPDAQQLAAARHRFNAAHLYGARVVVQQGDLAALRYPPYFANLIMDTGDESRGRPAISPAELWRLLKPCGGVAVIGNGRESPELWLQEFKRFRNAEAPAATSPAGKVESLRDGWDVASREGRVVITRGELPGAGWWSHQYADSGNTSCSGDRLVRGPFRTLWFGDPGPQGMWDRHAAGPAPLCVGGRLFVEGEQQLQAFDAYNGVPLWERTLEGAARSGMTEQASNLAAEGERLFVAGERTCLQLDAATGKTQQLFALPDREDGAKRRWGWLAVAGQRLFGSRSETERPFRNWPETSGHTAEAVFAYDVASGRWLWTYSGAAISQTALAVGQGQVFLLDARLTDQERAAAAEEYTRSFGTTATTPDRRGAAPARQLRKAVALDASSGQVRWSKPLDVTDIIVPPRGGQVNLICAGELLLIGSSPSGGDHHLAEFQAGQFVRRSLIALSAQTGEVRWAGRKNYLSRPTVIGEWIFAEPWAYDLNTGVQRMRPATADAAAEPWCLTRGAGGGCGATSASAQTLFFRAGTAAYCDLPSDRSLVRNGGQRWGCWINAIAAGGLVLAPEGCAECDCPYALQCTTVWYPLPSNAGAK